jgi:hypothetical protein
MIFAIPKMYGGAIFSQSTFVLKIIFQLLPSLINFLDDSFQAKEAEKIRAFRVRTVHLKINIVLINYSIVPLK